VKRVKDNGVVHFLNRTAAKTLCGQTLACCDLFGVDSPTFSETTEKVTCRECVRLYSEIKNAPWNEVADKVLDRSCYDAVKPTEQLKQEIEDDSEKS